MHDGKVTAVKTTESKECELNGNSYSVHTVGLYLILKFLNGITIIWDKNTRISVILDPRWNVCISLSYIYIYMQICIYKYTITENSKQIQIVCFSHVLLFATP